MKKTNKHSNIKKELYETLVKAIASTEKHCSFDGNMIIITGNTKNLDNRSLANSAVLDPDKFLWLKLKKNVFNVSIDHGNGYEGTTDKYGNAWMPRLAYYAYDDKGVKHHYFGTTLLKEYPGKGNWEYQF